MSLDVDAVLGELSERRRSRPDMTVATMTVIAFFEDPAVGEWTRDRLHALAAKHPSRAIVLDGTLDAGAQHVGSECPEHDDCIKTRGDWIELGVRGIDPNVLHSAIFALSLPEAPVVLIWVASGVASDARFERMAPAMRAIVFNTSVIDFDDSALRELIAFAREGVRVTISDLAYLRLYPWQEAVAQFFDAELLEELSNLRRVEITCGSDPEAFYLLGWLASRLGWKAASPTSFVDALGAPVEFSIVRKGMPRRILRIELATADVTFLAEIDDERAEAIMLTVSGSRTHCGRARPINNIDLAALVERAILTGHSDRVFQESLLAAGEILDRRKG